MKVAIGNIWRSDRGNISTPSSDIILNLRYISTIGSDMNELYEMAVLKGLVTWEQRKC